MDKRVLKSKKIFQKYMKLIEVSYKEKNIEDFLKIINKEQQIV